MPTVREKKLEQILRTAAKQLDLFDKYVGVFDETEFEQPMQDIRAARAEIEKLPNTPQSVRLRALSLIADWHFRVAAKASEELEDEFNDLALKYWPERYLARRCRVPGAAKN